MVLSSSSLSEPPEELLSEAAGGTLLFAFMAASGGKKPGSSGKNTALKMCPCKPSAGFTLTTWTVVLFGLLVHVAGAWVNGRTAPGPAL